MSMSGVKLASPCVDAYQQVKKDKLKYATFKLNDKKTEIVLEASEKYSKPVTPDAFEQFLSLLPDSECRYAVYHAIVTLEDDSGTKADRDKIVFISWAPDNASIKTKMLHSSSKDAIKKAFEGVAIEFQLSGEDEKQAPEWIDKIGTLPNVKLAGRVTSFEGRPVEDW